MEAYYNAHDHTLDGKSFEAAKIIDGIGNKKSAMMEWKDERGV